MILHDGVGDGARKGKRDGALAKYSDNRRASSSFFAEHEGNHTHMSPSRRSNNDDARTEGGLQRRST